MILNAVCTNYRKDSETLWRYIILSTISNIETIAITMPDIRNYRHIYCIKESVNRIL